MRRFAVPQWARLGLLAAAIACTFGCRQHSAPAVAGSRENPRPVKTEPETAPAPIEEQPVEEQPVKEEPVGETPVNEGPVEEPSAKEDLSERNPLAGCQQCHVDIEDEYAVSLHFKMKIACTDCHGPSEGHLADENNEVKPDEVFARKDVDRLCGTCHGCSRPTADESTADRSKVCTDCHGPHDLAQVKETQ